MQTLIHITYLYSHSICLCIKFGGVRFISVLVATFSFVFEFFYIRVLCHTCISKVFGTQNIPIRNDATDAYERENDEKRTKNRFQNRNLFNIYVIIWCSLIVVLRIIKCISKVFEPSYSQYSIKRWKIHAYPHTIYFEKSLLE